MSFMDWKSGQGSGSKGKEVNQKDTYGGGGIDRISQVGSIRSNMSLSAADRKLEALQAEVTRLNNITKQQAETIERLHQIVAKLQRKK